MLMVVVECLVLRVLPALLSIHVYRAAYPCAVYTARGVFACHTSLAWQVHGINVVHQVGACGAVCVFLLLKQQIGDDPCWCAVCQTLLRK
jgi:hypothetical protein